MWRNDSISVLEGSAIFVVNYNVNWSLFLSKVYVLLGLLFNSSERLTTIHKILKNMDGIILLVMKNGISTVQPVAISSKEYTAKVAHFTVSPFR